MGTVGGREGEIEQQQVTSQTKQRVKEGGGGRGPSGPAPGSCGRARHGGSIHVCDSV